MRKSLILAIPIAILYSCHGNGNGELERKIEAHITNACKSKICTIDLSKITSFKWKRFYVFKETSSLELVEQTINQKYPYFTDVARRLVFLDENNKIIYHEDIFPEVDGVTSKDIVFCVPDTVNFRVYTTPQFTVTKIELEKGYYYLLNQ